MVDEAKYLKELLGQQAKDIIARGYGFKANKSKKVLCPLHNDKNPSMSWYKQGLMWRCHACEGTIDIYTYYQEKEGLTFQEAVKKVGELIGRHEEPVRARKIEYKKPNITMKDLQKPFIDYMARRKISKKTLDDWKVKQSTWNGQGVYVFQYFNEKDELEYVSYRGLGKGALKGGCEKNSKPILWGMWHINKDKPMIITEGQPDAMAVWEAGERNVVSVPNGSNNFQWIDNCWEWLQDIKEIIVFADNDKPGLKMAEEIKSKLNNVKVIEGYKYKDANEVLYFQGKNQVIELIEEVKNTTPKGLLDLSEVEYQSSMRGEQETVETGFYEYDKHIEDWKMEEITIITGRNNEGKTTFISQIIAHCIKKDVKTFLYSGEMSENKIQDWLYRQIIGNKQDYLRTIITKYGDKKEPRPEVVNAIKQWHQGKLFLYDRNEEEITGELDSFFKVMELARKRYGAKLFIIDNLMAILEENAESLYSDQANFVQRCKNFAISNKCHVVLLTHPNKLGAKELYNASTGNIDKSNISGSGNIGNKADNIIAVERDWGDDRSCDCFITSLKDRETGQRKMMMYNFSSQTLRFYNNVTKENTSYGWEKYLRGVDLFETFEPAPWDDD